MKVTLAGLFMKVTSASYTGRSLLKLQVVGMKDWQHSFCMCIYTYLYVYIYTYIYI